MATALLTMVSRPIYAIHRGVGMAASVLAAAIVAHDPRPAGEDGTLEERMQGLMAVCSPSQRRHIRSMFDEAVASLERAEKVIAAKKN